MLRLKEAMRHVRTSGRCGAHKRTLRCARADADVGTRAPASGHVTQRAWSRARPMVGTAGISSTANEHNVIWIVQF